MAKYLKMALGAGGCLVAAGLALALTPPMRPIVHSNAAGAWENCPDMPPGCQRLFLYGDPSKPGEFGVRLKYAAHYRIGPHKHAGEEHATVIAGGPMHIATGDVFDDKSPTAQTVHVTDMVVVPAGIHHFAWMDAETILQVNSMGPFKREFLDPEHNGSGVPK